MSAILKAEVTESPIDPAALLALVDRPSVGAISLFVGRVRDQDPGATGEVVALDYTCHPSAPQRLAEIVAETLARLDPAGECQVATAHRIGHLTVGETAFVVAVSAVHRALAFQVCQGLVDDVKRQLPIWKQQFEADGHHTWSGL